LLAVEYAILVDRHGQTLQEVAKRHGWSRDTARNHVNLGRDILTADKN
jgi:hypothetical protein